MTLVSADTKLQGRWRRPDCNSSISILTPASCAAGPLPGPSDPQTQKAYSAPIVWQGRRGVTYRQRSEPVKRRSRRGNVFVWAAYVAHGRMIAVRLNGKDLPIPSK